MSNGLILGHIEGNASKWRGIMSLFDPEVEDKIACQRFLKGFQRKQRKQQKQLVRLSKAVHTMVVAPTGVGKGVSCIIPFLLTCPDSCVVVDFKGENALKTAEYRRRKFGHKIVLLDPFTQVTKKESELGDGNPEKLDRLPDTFNPLQFIDNDSPTALDECRDLAEALVIRTGQEKEPFWNDSAEVWIAAMTAAVVAFAEDGDKSLQSVRALLTNPQRIEAAIKLMCESDAWEGMLARLGHQLTHFKDKELASTLTTTNRFLRFLDTIAISQSTKQSSFNPADLLTGRMTVYLVLPPDHMRAQSPLLRLWIGSLLRAVVKGGLQEKIKTHFVLDEAASLGHMDALDDAVDKFRGYGVRLQLYYQSLGQLKKCWPEGQDQTVLSNTTQVFYGVNDPQTAEYVSTRLGEETIIVQSGGTSHSTSRQAGQQHGGHSYSTSSNHNWSQMGRRLLKPEEVAGLDPRIAITFTPGLPPIWTWLVRYYERGWDQPTGLSPAKMIFDAACLFLAAGMLAALWTAGLYYGVFR